MKITCPELERLRENAAATFLEARQIRRTRDVSVFEDTQMFRDGRSSIYALIRHLLVGHDGCACPAGDRPIVTPHLAPRASSQLRRDPRRL